SQPDAFLNTPFLASLPLVGRYLEHIHLLPFLVTGAMILSMRMMPQSPASTPEQEAVQKTMMRIMPIMFGMFSWIFSAGLNLYVLVSTILGIVQNQLVRTSGINEPVPAAASATGD